MIKKIKNFFALQTTTGILLFIATLASFLIVNSSNYQIFQQFFTTKLSLNLDLIGIVKKLSLQDWINDGLMAIFFFLVGIDLKEEILAGELASKERIMLPAIAAVGGVIFPALIFCLFNFNHPQNLSGFAIPTATDIAFAYGVLCFFGKKISKSLKVFLISLAIFDDLIAIIIIAVFYSHNLDLTYILLTILLILLLLVFNLKNYRKMTPYLILGCVLWLIIFNSGIHPTIAGVVLAMFIPHNKDSFFKLIKIISPLVNFFILPIFVFVNSGVRIDNFSIDILTKPLFLGVALGLFLGKQLGVMLFSFLGVKFGFCRLPKNSNNKSNWLDFYGVAILTGIGFTMSFFIGSLAFMTDNLLFYQVKIAVLLASALSAIYGILVIYISSFKKT